MGVIYLVRHGQAPPEAYGVSAWSQPAGALTELGREQARLTGQALASRIDRLDVALAGDLARQQETLWQVLTALSADVAPDYDPRWNEYDINAVLGGNEVAVTTTGPALQRILDAALDDWIVGRQPSPELLETYSRYRQRCSAALESARQLAGSGKTVLVVSSSGTITQILAQRWGVDGQDWIRMSRTMINASITKLIVGRDGVSVVSMNEHAHLDIADTSGARRLMTFR
jgi:broad specificity phosphatase PhoE